MEKRNKSLLRFEVLFAKWDKEVKKNRKEKRSGSSRTHDVTKGEDRDIYSIDG